MDLTSLSFFLSFFLFFLRVHFSLLLSVDKRHNNVKEPAEWKRWLKKTGNSQVNLNVF